MYKLANPASTLAERLMQYNQLCNILPVTALAEFSGEETGAYESIHVPVHYRHNTINESLLTILRDFVKRQRVPDFEEGTLNIMVVHDGRNQLSAELLDATVRHLVKDKDQADFTVWYLAGRAGIVVSQQPGIPYVDDYRLMANLGRADYIIFIDSILAYMTALACGKVAACPLNDVPGRNLPVIQGWPRFRHLWSYSQYFEAVYFINLDRRADRRARMEEMLANRFSMAARRVGALDGRGITWDHAKMGPITRYWNQGALGCVLSHREAILDAIRRGYERVLILEDDADISEQFFPTLEKAWTALPADWHMLYLSANLSEPVSERLNESLYRLRKGLGAHAIIWHRRAFEQCLGFLSGPYAPWDMFLSYYQLFFPCYITNPGMATVTAGISDILGQDVDYGAKINYADPLHPRI
jgi:GR25 family glycosyltransferase involved in LPS biosynthesis